jgi:hypothetical protein
MALVLAVLGGGWGTWGPLLILGAVPELFWMAASPRVQRLGGVAVALARTPRFQWLTLGLASPLLGLWWACQSSQPAGAPTDPHFLEPLPIRAYTDQGRPVDLFARRGKWPPAEEVLRSEGQYIRQAGLVHQLIRSAPAAQHYNCHGWVFTGGRYWVHGKDVGQILWDNGYRRVNFPQTDDLAIYQDGFGRPVHIGVVRGVGRDKMILIESKWGTLGRYIHTSRVEYMDLAGDCTYYHSDRSGHLLLGLPGP